MKKCCHRGLTLIQIRTFLIGGESQERNVDEGDAIPAGHTMNVSTTTANLTSLAS